MSHIASASLFQHYVHCQNMDVSYNLKSVNLNGDTMTLRVNDYHGVWGPCLTHVHTFGWHNKCIFSSLCEITLNPII